MKLFAQIRKVDEAKRLVFGRAAEEAVDKADEIMDYASSRPHFEKWSADIAADTDGKSLGNVRAMHGKVAAGKLTGIDFSDSDRAVDVCAKVVDDNEWNKVLEGVYTGFSIGGSYSNRKVEKIDDRSITRYTAIPTEISLVDRPCMPGAKFFEVQKADGSLAKVDFKPAEPEPVDVTGTPDEVAELGKAMNELGLSVTQVIEKIKARGDVTPGEKNAAVANYGDVTYADEANKKYPLDSAEHVRAAASYFGKSANRSKYSAADQEKIDAKIGAAKKKLGVGEDAEKAEIALTLRKGLYTCGALANLLAQIEYIKSSVEYEAEMEGDGSALGGRITQWLADGGSILTDMVAEEVAEATAAKGDTAAVMALAERAGALQKALILDLAKVGARNSAADQKRIQEMHDHSAALGAKCAAGDAAAEKAAKVEAARALLKARVADPDALAAKTGDEILKLAEALPKAEDAKLEKLIAETIAPLQKALDAAAVRIKQLEDQPAPARVSLRAVSKAADVIEDPLAKVTPDKPAPVVDSHGEEHEAASLIKSLHARGGVSMTLPAALRP